MCYRTIPFSKVDTKWTNTYMTWSYMESSIWDGISDMNEKTPPADMANVVLHSKKSTCFYLLVLYPRRHMPSIQNGKNINIFHWSSNLFACKFDECWHYFSWTKSIHKDCQSSIANPSALHFMVNTRDSIVFWFY